MRTDPLAAPRPALRRLTASLLAAALLLAPHAARADEAERFTGTARGSDGAVLYLEEHAVELDAGRPRAAVTTYRDPSGRPIAELRTDFSTGLAAPSYAFTDLRTGAVERVTVGEGEVRLEARGEARTLPRPGRLATGQGLDRLVRERLPALAAGERLKIRYAFPSRHDVYEFRLRALEADDRRVRVRVELASFLLRLLAPDLEVEYDRASGRLLRYRGASNLDFGGENPQVDITYTYPAASVAAGEEPLRHDP